MCLHLFEREGQQYLAGGFENGGVYIFDLKNPSKEIYSFKHYKEPGNFQKRKTYKKSFH